jgi:hypothetical protein
LTGRPLILTTRFNSFRRNVAKVVLPAPCGPARYKHLPSPPLSIVALGRRGDPARHWYAVRPREGGSQDEKIGGQQYRGGHGSVAVSASQRADGQGRMRSGWGGRCLVFRQRPNLQPTNGDHGDVHGYEGRERPSSVNEPYQYGNPEQAEVGPQKKRVPDEVPDIFHLSREQHQRSQRTRACGTHRKPV